MVIARLLVECSSLPSGLYIYRIYLTLVDLKEFIPFNVTFCVIEVT
jgi:hypothetical protein